MSKEKSRKYFIPRLKHLWNKRIEWASKIEEWQIKNNYHPSITRFFDLTSTLVMIFIGIPILYLISKISEVIQE